MTAIGHALEGASYLTPAVTKDVMDRMGGADAAPGDAHAAQREVLRLIAKGQRMKEIAAALQLSTRTVETQG